MIGTRNMPVTLFVLVVISVVCSNDAQPPEMTPERTYPLNVLQEFWQQEQLVTAAQRPR
jgi:hypothetical protein